MYITNLFVGVCRCVLVCVGVCWCVLVCVGMRWSVLVCVGMCWHALVRVGMYWCVNYVTLYYSRQVLEFHKSTGLDDLGPVKWSIALCLLAVFILVYFALWKGIKSSGKVRMLACNAIILQIFNLFTHCLDKLFHEKTLLLLQIISKIDFLLPIG